jgi:hypothetical protein
LGCKGRRTSNSRPASATQGDPVSKGRKKGRKQAKKEGREGGREERTEGREERKGGKREKKKKKIQACWYMLVVPATQEAKGGESQSKADPDKSGSQMWGVTEVEECLPNKSKAPSSFPSNTGGKKKLKIHSRNVMVSGREESQDHRIRV